MLHAYIAKYTKIRSGCMGQLVEWPEVVTEGKSLDDARFKMRLQEMIAAYRPQHKEIPLGTGLVEQIPAEVWHVVPRCAKRPEAFAFARKSEGYVAITRKRLCLVAIIATAFATLAFLDLANGGRLFGDVMRWMGLGN